VRLARRLLFKHGGKMILISHAIGHIRSFVALSAGAARMRYTRFLAFELVAALLWNIGYALLGYFLGTQRERLELLLTRGGWVVAGVVIAIFVAWRVLAPRLERWGAPRRMARLMGGRE
jgi:membrane protein DedA with SNARE-associated domain